MVAILNSGNQPASGNVERGRDVSSIVANVGVTVGIASSAHCVQHLFPLPISMAAILNLVGGRRREMFGNVDSVIFKSGLVENVGVEVEIASISHSVQMLLPLSFLRPPSWISGFRLHATTMASAPLDSLTSKIGGSRWNFVPMCHRT